MSSELLLEFANPSPNEKVWADTTDFSVSGITRTDQITLASLASGAARQGDKVDLGVNPADEYIVECAFEFGSSPTAGDPVLVYFSFSDNATGLNSGGLGDSDAAGVTAASARAQLLLGGVFPALASGSGTTQRSVVGIIRPTMRYVVPNIYNATGQAFHSDDVEMYVRLIPRVIEAQ